MSTEIEITETDGTQTMAVMDAITGGAPSLLVWVNSVSEDGRLNMKLEAAGGITSMEIIRNILRSAYRAVGGRVADDD